MMHSDRLAKQRARPRGKYIFKKGEGVTTLTAPAEVIPVEGYALDSRLIDEVMSIFKIMPLRPEQLQTIQMNIKHVLRLMKYNSDNIIYYQNFWNIFSSFIKEKGGEENTLIVKNRLDNFIIQFDLNEWFAAHQKDFYHNDFKEFLADKLSFYRLNLSLDKERITDILYNLAKIYHITSQEMDDIVSDFSSNEALHL